jgi:hypothetical protein
VKGAWYGGAAAPELPGLRRRAKPTDLPLWGIPGRREMRFQMGDERGEGRKKKKRVEKEYCKFEN